MRKVAICFFILLSCLRASAIEAVIAHTLFYVKDPANNNQLRPSLETSWQVDPKTVHYSTTPEKTIIARIRTDIVFTNAAGFVKQDHFILQTVPSVSIGDLMRHSIIDLRRYVLDTGFIKMKFTLTDQADTTNKFTYTDSFAVAAAPDAAFYSGLQLIDTFIDSHEQTEYLKNGRQQVPASTNFLDDSKKTLHYYAELYEVDQLSKSNYPLYQKTTISKKQGDTHFGDFMKRDTINAGNITFTSGSFPLSTLTSGNYYLNITLENYTHKTIASADLFFQLMNLHPTEPEDVAKKTAAEDNDTGIENINVLNLNKTFLAKYKTEEVMAILKMLLPQSDAMGTQTINNFLKKPDDLYMRYYVYNYFKSINPADPGQAWKDYSDKVIKVNKLFKASGTRGYQTDRGFIYLKYGEPTEIITVENESGTLPYEIWQYNTLPQANRKDMADAVFLFYKRNDMISDYKLLHSNVPGEVQNKAWRSYLYVTGQGGNNTDSRAEQYIGNK